ncbi:MAG: hypothetical protein FWB91_09520 [Defluviitaleaceae bacterium]|nr:hypothetical protein [Defluviitaleaceae bacterium]
MTWVYAKGSPHEEIIEFTGKRFNLTTYRKAGAATQDLLRETRTGTFSVSRNRIELDFQDGEIRVLAFVLAENALALDGRNFFRGQYINGENNIH